MPDHTMSAGEVAAELVRAVRRDGNARTDRRALTTRRLRKQAVIRDRLASKPGPAQSGPAS